MPLTLFRYFFLLILSLETRNAMNLDNILDLLLYYFIVFFFFSLPRTNCRNQSILIVISLPRARKLLQKSPFRTSFVINNRYIQKTRSKIVTWSKIFDFGQVLFSSACMCLSVCLSVILYLAYLKKF